MKIEHDKIADAIYIYISNNKVAMTVHVSDSINIDFDNEHKMIGIEVINASQNLPKKYLAPTEQTPHLI